MADYRQALQEGFAAAKKAEAARKEVAEVLARLKEEVLAASNGKLLVEVQEFQEAEEQATSLRSLTLGSALRPPKKYHALAAKNPVASRQLFAEIARWKQAKDGYPCSLIRGSQERQCEDRTALEEGLAEVLKDPLVGEKLYRLTQLN